MNPIGMTEDGKTDAQPFHDALVEFGELVLECFQSAKRLVEISDRAILGWNLYDSLEDVQHVLEVWVAL